MPFTMTRESDVVEVVFKEEEGDFTIKVGTIPAEIGEKIDACNARSLALFRSSITGENIEENSVSSKQAQREASGYLIKYGVRGHKGLQDSEGEEIDCLLEVEEGTGYKILSDETLALYMGNHRFMQLVGEKIVVLEKIGLANYKRGGEKLLKSFQAKEVDMTAPFMKELQESLSTSTQSAKKKKKP